MKAGQGIGYSGREVMSRAITRNGLFTDFSHELMSYKELAITDRNTLAGIVRAHIAARDKDIRIIPACRLDLLDGPALLAYPTDKDAYARLSALLSEGNLRTEKGKCHLYKADVFRYAQGMKFIIIPPSSL